MSVHKDKPSDIIKIIFIGAIAILFVCAGILELPLFVSAAALPPLSEQRQFNANQWRSKQHRANMVYDILFWIKIPGRTREQVVALLGKPDQSDPERLDIDGVDNYRLSDSNGIEYATMVVFYNPPNIATGALVLRDRK